MIRAASRLTGAATRRLSWAVVLIAAGAAACTFAPAPIKDRPQIVATPKDGQLSVTSSPGKAIGSVQPVYVSIANGTDTPRTVVPNQIFALNDDGSRVAPLPPAEAARQAGGAGELIAIISQGPAAAGKYRNIASRSPGNRTVRPG